MTHSLMYCMSLMGESTYRTDSSIIPIDYTDEDEDFVDEGEYIEELLFFICIPPRACSILLHE